MAHQICILFFFFKLHLNSKLIKRLNSTWSIFAFYKNLFLDAQSHIKIRINESFLFKKLKSKIKAYFKVLCYYYRHLKKDLKIALNFKLSFFDKKIYFLGLFLSEFMRPKTCALLNAKLPLFRIEIS